MVYRISAAGNVSHVFAHLTSALAPDSIPISTCSREQNARKPNPLFRCAATHLYMEVAEARTWPT